MQVKVCTIEFKFPRWLKRAFVFAVVPAALVLGVVAVVCAASVPSLPQFADAETLSAAKLNGNFETLRVAINSIDGSQITTGTIDASRIPKVAQATAADTCTSAISASNATNCSNAVPGSALATAQAKTLQIQKVIGPQTTVAPGTIGFSTISCPSGYIASSISCTDNTQAPPMVLNTAAVSATVTESPQVGTCGYYYNNTNSSQMFTGYVTCLAFQATP
jgi:hypothetical protein